MAKAKAKIYRALLELLQIKKIEDIKIRELIQKAGVGRNTYYYYFYSIENVLETMVDEFFDSFVTHVHYTNQLPNSIHSAREPDSPFFKASLALWQFIYDQRQLIYTLHRHHYGYEFMQRFVQCVRESYRPTLLYMKHLHHEEEEQILSHDAFYDYYITRLSFSYYATLQTWMEHNFVDTPEEVNRHIIYGYSVYSAHSNSTYGPTSILPEK